MRITKENEELIKRITEASEAYYISDPLMSDEEFDSLIKEAKTRGLEIATKVGFGHVAKENKIKHNYFVGSLDKIQEIDYNPSEYLTASLKLDGLTIVSTYDSKGSFSSSATRGDGTYGIDVTERLRSLVPTHFNPNGSIRSELLFKKSVFNKFLSKDYANSRNAISGVLLSKDEIEAHKYMSLITFQVFENKKDITTDIFTGGGYYDKLEIVPTTILNPINEKSITIEQLKHWRDTSDYPTDGVVLMKGDETRIALKFETEKVPAVVGHIEWNLSDKGRLIPVVNLKDPVQLYGTTVKRATAFHAKFVYDHNMQDGAIIQITKANEIVPYIVSVEVSSNDYDLLNSIPGCPSCYKKPIWEGVNLVCVNPKCPNKIKSSLAHFITVHYSIDGIADVLINKMIDYLKLDSWEKLIDFINNEDPNKFNELIKADGIGKSKVDLLKKAFNKKELDIRNLIRSLNLCDAGHTFSEKYASDIPKIIETKTIETYPNVSYKARDILIENIDLLKLLYERLKWTKSMETKDCKFKVVVTGKLSVPRKVFIDFCESNLVKLTESLNKEVKYLITDDPNSGSSKNVAADKLGIEKISEEQFRQILKP